jgi:class 3 adenylate cyclase
LLNRIAMTSSPPGGALIPSSGQHWASQNRYLLRDDMTRVGRDFDCDIVISDRAISRRHAEFVWDGERLVLIPMSEINGTLVNGRIAQGPTPLNTDDTIEFADARFTVTVHINSTSASASTQNSLEINRRLTAIVSADVMSYSELIEKDDVSTMYLINRCRGIFDALTQEHAGRTIDAVGDSILVELPSVSGAFAAAVEFQQRIERSAHGVKASLQFRIGVHVGEIVTRPDGTVYGNAVNMAARIQHKAEPGHILATQLARDLAVRLPEGYRFIDAGVHELKNISGTHRLYALVPHGDPSGGALTPGDPTATHQRLTGE